MSQAPSLGIISEFFEALEEFNKRFFKTTIAIIKNPVEVMDKVHFQKSKLEYVNPIRYAFLIFSFYALCAAYLEIDMQTLGAVNSSTDAEVNKFLQLFYKFVDSISVFFAFISLVPLAWLVAKLFKASGKDTLYCYKLSLYGYALGAVFNLLIFVPVKLVFPGISPDQMLVLMHISGIFYFALIGWMYFRVFSTGTWEVIWKTAITYVFYQFVAFLVFVIIAIALGIKVGLEETAGQIQPDKVQQTTVEPAPHKQEPID